jgi:phosphate starvation-inducible protein PhoH
MVITTENVALLRQAYDKAVATKKETFTFQGEEYATSYAKYLLEWLDTQVTITK